MAGTLPNAMNESIKFLINFAAGGGTHGKEGISVKKGLELDTHEGKLDGTRGGGRKHFFTSTLDKW